MKPLRRVFAVALGLAVSGFGPVRGAEYLTDIKPLLRDRCYACHGALKQKADLRLDTAESMQRGGKSGPAIDRNTPDRSLILQRVTTTNPDDRMPPEHEGEPFTAAQVKLLRDWIAAGASAPRDEKPEADPRDHWAFRPVERPPVPPAAGTGWVRNPIDAFLARQHAEHGLTPQPEAPREVLVRRLHFDLIGLPPGEGELAAALRDPSPQWYEAMADRLLSDPRHGERWARHWMDVWRYSDWWGLGDQLRNSQKHIWHWRDWIVDSLNADLPYDEMVRLMLAADELHPNDLDRLRATGFLARQWFLFNRNQWLEETVEHVSKAFLGLTMNCTKCHDHKYDPFRQADFYRMRAFFEPYHARMDLLPGEPDLAKDGLPRAFDGLLDTPTYLFVRGQESQPDKSAVIAPGVPALLEFEKLNIRPVPLPVEAWQPERRTWVIESHLAAARKKVAETGRPLPELKQALAAALRREADLIAPLEPGPNGGTHAPPASRESALQAVNEARTALSVAEAAFASAGAELDGIERRAEAMRAEWARQDAEALPEAGPDTPGSKPAAIQDPSGTGRDGERRSVLSARAADAASAALKAERDVAVSKARLAVAEAERRHFSAPADRKDAIEKEIRKAREALDAALKTAATAPKPEEKFTPLVGAQWTPTRFFNSTADDPIVRFPRESSGRRRALAAWITDRRNPLAARVAVNHLWARHLGVPLVGTVFEFGRKGTPPTNPELLDWLAAEFMESGWSMKHLHRLIVTSAAYRMSSSLAGGESKAAKDPDNVHLWRRVPIRLEAEAVRDAMLALAGTLDSTRGGPPVAANEQENSKRRSLYFFHSNNDRNLFLTTFDQAAVKECYRRDQSIVPQQALALSNSRLALDAAGQIAARLASAEPEGSGAPDADAFIRRAFLAVLGISPGEAEMAACRQALAEWSKLEASAPDRSTVGRTNLVRALLNHNDFVTLR